MKNLLAGIALSALLIFYFSSCTKTGATGPAGSTGPTGSTGPILTGTLTGYVTTYDEYGFRVNSSQAGVTVHVSDSTQDSTLTNSAGQYTFSNLKTGVYNLTYSEPGFAPYIAYDFAFIGGGTQQRNVTMSKYPSFNLFGIIGFDTTVVTDPGVLIRGIDTADQVARSFIVFASSNSTVSSAPGSYTYVNTGTIKASAVGFNLFLYSQDLHDNGLASGSTVYFIVYPYSTGSPTYIDPVTGRTVYTALGNPSPVFNVTIP